MKTKRIFAVILLVCALVCSCSSNPLKKYERNDQYNVIDYDTFVEKRSENESFVVFVSQEMCSSCAEYYPVVASVLESNKDYKIYSMEAEDITPVNKLILLANISSTLGKEYLESNGYDSSKIYTPLTILVVDGEIEKMDIGVIDEEKLKTYYEYNFEELKDFYDYNRKIAKGKSFNLFVSSEENSEYKNSLKNYFNLNKQYTGSYLNSKSLSDTQKSKLLERINGLLEDDITELPSEYVLTYKNGTITNYQPIKCTTEDLNNIYVK